MDSLSDQNPLVKQIRRAVSRGTLTEDGYAVAEGAHLLEEAVAARCEIRAVIVAESAAYQSPLPQTRTVSDKTFRTLASTETPQGVIALVRPPSAALDELFRGDVLLIVLDGVQDPGNAGAILRTAEAFGATGAVFLKGSVNPYNPKCLRASAGSAFRVPLVAAVEEEALLGQNIIAFYAAMPRAQKLIEDTDLASPCAIIIGSEGRGVSPALEARAIGLRISTVRVESLNAAMAAGIILYEARRQRTRT